MAQPIPDLKWYTSVGAEMGTNPRCPFATADACPRFYQSLSLLGQAGSTAIEENEDQRLLEKWRASDLWPRTGEQETSIGGPNGRHTHFWNFCPEVAFERFGYFASDLNRHADEIDTEQAHCRLAEQSAPSDHWGWAWSSVSPIHFTACPLYSVLAHRAASPAPATSEGPAALLLSRYASQIIIGVIVTVVGGLLLAVLL